MKMIIRNLITILPWLTLLIFGISQNTIAGSYTVYLHNGVLGNVVAKTNQRGHVISRESLTPFGQSLGSTDHSGKVTIGDTEHRIGYTGHVNDRDLGLTYMQARYYDPTVGRFMGVDPVSYSPTKPTLFNRFAYANNNPYKYVDPDGRYSTAAFATLAGIGMLGSVTGVIDFDKMKTSVIDGIDAYSSTGTYAEDSFVFSEDSTDDKPDDVAKSESKKQRNKPPEALTKADGRPHSIIEKPGADGQYTTHNGDGTFKQFRGAGKPHGKNIPRHNVKENSINRTPDGREFINKADVRPPKPDEIPGAQIDVK